MKKLSLISILILFTLSFFYWNCKKEEPELLIATSIKLDSGGGQVGEAGKALTEPIEILVRDQHGNAFKGATINFTVTEGTVSSATAITDATGKTSVIWILGSAEGEQRLIITAFNSEGTTLTNSPLIVKATATLAAAKIELVSGSGQTGNVVNELEVPVVVLVKDQNGNAFQGNAVYFSVEEGSVSKDTLTTDASGKVSIVWTLGESEGEQLLTITAFKTDGTTELSGSPIIVRATAILAKPTVGIISVDKISYVFAKCSGKITHDGGATISTCGLCWSTNANPTIADNKTIDWGGIGTFTSSITGLTEKTTYYVRAYATNEIGTSYGEEKSFTTLAFGSLTDYDGNVYKTAVIGNQEWMAENLKATHYANGVAIPLVTDNTTWGNLGDNNTDKAYCYYDYNASNEAETYGALYTWAAAMNGSSSSSSNPSNIQGICPTGWHLPSYKEWEQLEEYLGGYTQAANKLKENGLTHWYSPNYGTNESGFTAIPGGRHSGNTFHNIGKSGNWWSTTQYSNTEVWYRALMNNAFLPTYFPKSLGFSVRCVKGKGKTIPTITTSEVNSITINSAICGGNISDNGGTTITSRGLCWSTNENPAIDDNITTEGTGTGSFTCSLTGLTDNTTYYVRAYATNSEGTAYGEERIFTTLEITIATLSTTSISDIGFFTATCGGNVTYDGGVTVTSRGVCWSTSINPTIADSKTTDGTGTGTFTSSIMGLTENTTYYVRAYSTNSVGTAYGEEQTFKTHTVTTVPVTNISYTTVTCGGEVTSESLFSVTSRGVCWSTSQNPTISNNHTSDGDGTGSYISSLAGLSINITYYIRAYATNSEGTVYGEERVFTTLDFGSMTDYDGNSYKTVQIGDQIWMAENLKATHYPDGTSIPLITDNTEWYNLHNHWIDEAYCYYNNNNSSQYGALYNYASAIKACPSGWHLASDAEWTELENFVSNDGHSGVEGRVLKSKSGWSVHSNGTDDYGFGGLPGGIRMYNIGDANYSHATYWGFWWSSTETSDGLARYRQLDSYTVRQGNYYKSRGHSVRCIKN